MYELGYIFSYTLNHSENAKSWLNQMRMVYSRSGQSFWHKVLLPEYYIVYAYFLTFRFSNSVKFSKSQN